MTDHITAAYNQGWRDRDALNDPGPIEPGPAAQGMPSRLGHTRPQPTTHHHTQGTTMTNTRRTSRRPPTTTTEQQHNPTPAEPTTPTTTRSPLTDSAPTRAWPALSPEQEAYLQALAPHPTDPKQSPNVTA